MTTTAATTRKQDEFFNSLYTPESLEYGTLVKAKDEIVDIFGEYDLQWEIKRFNTGERILKFIIAGDFFSGATLEYVADTCKRMKLTWWMSDTAVFNGEVLSRLRVSLNVAVIGTTKN